MDRSIGCGIATGDLHVTAFADFSRHVGPDSLTPLGKSLIQTVSWLASLASQQSPLSWLLNDGDYTTTPGHLDAPTLFLLSKLEEYWSDIPNRILNIGNHDISSIVGLHNLALHARIPGWVVPSHKEVLQKHGLYVVPFTYSLEDQISLLRTIPNHSVVAVHTPIRGAQLNPQTVEESGVPLSEFSRFAFTLAGHYHTPQLLSSSNVRLGSLGAGLKVPLNSGDVLILGTPLPHSFADTSTVYGAWAVDPISGTAEFCPNPFAPLYINASVFSVEDLVAVQGRIQAAPGRTVYVSLTAPKALHRDLLKVDLQATGVRIRRTVEAAPTRESVRTPPGEGGVVRSLFAYLDMTGEPYSRGMIETDLTRELSLLPPASTKALGGRVNFINVSARNFMSYEELDFDLQTAHSAGLWLVTGVNKDTECGVSNGSGKSNLFESIVWGLYGDLLRGCPTKGSVIRFGEKSCSVLVDFDTNNNKYRVKRDRNNVKTSVSLYVFYGEGWKDISSGSAAETNKTIADVVGLSLEDFLLTTLFVSYVDSNFASAKDSDKKQFLRRVYDLEIFDLLLEVYKAKYRDCGNELSALKALIEREEKLLKSLLEDYEVKKEHVLQEIEEQKTQTISLSTSIAALSSQVGALEIESRELNECLTKIQGLLHAAYARDLRLELVRQNIVAEEKRLRDVPALTASRCKFCGQDVYGDRAQYEASCRHEAVEGEQEISRLRAEESRLLEGPSLPASTLAQKEELVSLEVRRKESLLSETRTALAIARERWAVLQSQPDPTIALDELQGRIGATEQHIAELRIKEETLHSKKALCERLLSALGPQGVVSYVLDRAVDQLNGYLEEISESLYGGDYSVRLSSTKELVDGRTANVISLQYSTPGNSFMLSSGGEKRKAEIALFIAVNYLLSDQARGSTNLVILDEALYALDYRAAATAVEAIRKFVHEEKKVGFLVCHSEEVKSLCDRQIIIERQNEISRIVTHGTL